MTIIILNDTRVKSSREGGRMTDRGQSITQHIKNRNVYHIKRYISKNRGVFNTYLSYDERCNEHVS